MSNNLLIIAGETSGDMHASNLMKSMNEKNSSFNFYGVGGDLMIANGLEASYHINEFAFLGFSEIIKHLPFISKVKQNLVELVNQKDIHTVILIDYPGFNLSIAKKFKAMGKKIIYYISPQLWAWGKGRIKKVKRLVDEMLVVFPFEEKFYKEHNVNSTFVGHPLIERIKSYNFLEKDEFYKKYNLCSDKELLLIMPGSRLQEIENIFSESVKAAKSIAEKNNFQIVVGCASNIDDNIFKNINAEVDYKVIKDENYNLLKLSSFGIIKSGTSTVEAGLMGLPFIVVYKTSKTTYLIGKALIKLKNIAMVNIILGETIIPELIQDDVNEQTIIKYADEFLSDSNSLEKLKVKLSSLKNILGDKNASDTAADIIIRSLNDC